MLQTCHSVPGDLADIVEGQYWRISNGPRRLLHREHPLDVVMSDFQPVVGFLQNLGENGPSPPAPELAGVSVWLA